MSVTAAARKYAKGCKDQVVRKALEMAFIAGANHSNGKLLAALKALRGDEWRCTVDWGPREPRNRINRQADKAIADAESGHAQDSSR